jgi:hypothetical protein
MFEGDDKAIADEESITKLPSRVVNLFSDSDNDKDDAVNFNAPISSICASGWHAIWRSSVFSQFIITISHFLC